MSTEIRQVQKGFERAGLRMEMAERAGRFGGGVFSMDVAVRKVRGGRAQEVFRMFAGDAETIRVLDVDPSYKQLVLLIREAEQEFVRWEYDPETRRRVKIVDRTDPVARKYLIGMDERSYFMAELPADMRTTVADAHASLKTDAVRSVEQRKGRTPRIVRQGEWFFVPATRRQRERLRGEAVFRKRRIGRQAEGKPHVADRIVYVGEEIFVHGAVRHPDHATVRFGEWVRVFRNRENREPTPGPGGPTRWID